MGKTIKSILKNLSFAVISQDIGEIYIFSTPGKQFQWLLQALFWLHYHNLINSSTWVNIKANSEYISAESVLLSAETKVPELKTSTPNSVDKEMILSKTALISSVVNREDSEKVKANQLWKIADQRWCFPCSVTQRWSLPILWNGAFKRWLSLRIQASFSQKLPDWCWWIYIKIQCVFLNNPFQFKKSTMSYRKKGNLWTNKSKPN